jgi:hypothetical protein
MSSNQVASTVTTQIVPVQGQFDQYGNCLNLIGPGGVVFYAPTTTSTSNIYATNQLGYTNGAFSTVTQTNNKATAVTCNTSAGQITMSNAQLAPNASVAFTVNCSLISAKDTVIVNIASGGTLYAYLEGIAAIADGSFVINIKNVSNNAYSEALVLNYAILHVAV